MVRTRRTMLATLVRAGAASGLAGLWHPVGAAPAPGDLLPLPAGTLRLERRLERALGERDRLTVTRSWEVRFERQGRGIMAQGQQRSAAVDAPPHLAEFAKIEAQRDAGALFPLMLSDQGIIMNTPQPLGPSEDVAAAVRVAEALIAGQPGPQETQALRRHYLALLQQAGARLLDRLPYDLLFPAGEPITQSDEVALPDGSRGRFALSYQARPQGGAPWLDRAEREVTTWVAGITRTSREIWTLSEV